MSFTSRRLPHWYPDHTPLFVTFRLRGTLPRNRFPPPRSTSGQAFVWMDRFLDDARYGPTWLKDERVAGLVRDALHYSSERQQLFDLHAWVIMPNHVHALLTPIAHPSKLLQSIKGFSAREANSLLLRTGEPFWQEESYDHWVREDREFQSIERYIEENPVRAGLARSAEEYRWSSAYAGSKAGMAG